MVQDTIYAMSTPGGRSAISVIRVSGARVLEILEGMTARLPLARVFTPCILRDPGSLEIIDQAAVIWLPAPRSYTGEDCVEFHIHGSVAVQKAMFEVLSTFAGVRLAEPGEFTRRAVVNGKMDLVEAEGVADLLDARTARQRRQAISHVSGKASSVFEGWREQLLSLRAALEAAVDFADEAGVGENFVREIDEKATVVLGQMNAALVGSKSAELVREGVRVVLAGNPNTGKSSLLNTIARRDVAIVSEVAGTTRDVLEVTLELEGVPVIITDTAGVRENSADPIEREGIRRSRKHMGAADILVWVASPDIAGSGSAANGIVADIEIVNKADLFGSETRRDANDRTGFLEVSCHSCLGISALLSRLSALVLLATGNESTVIVSQREKELTRQSIHLLNEFLEIDPSFLEIRAEVLRAACDCVGRITGRIGVEEWLGAIFSRFCIGK